MTVTTRPLRVAMVVYSDIPFDSRVQREANSLTEAGHSVTIFCLVGSHASAPMLDPRVEIVARDADEANVVAESPSPFHQGHGPSALRAYRARFTWLLVYVRNLRAWGKSITSTPIHFDVWHAHDFTGLVAIAGMRQGRAALVFDVHDLFTETGTGARLPRPIRAMLRWYERRLVQNVDLVVTVNHGLAEVVRQQDNPRSLVVVHNCAPRWWPPALRPDLLREAAGIPGDADVILYHGLLSANRGIDQLFDAMLEPGLNGAHLALLGFGLDRERLRRLAGDPRFEGRVHVLDAVSPEALLRWVASADVGAMAMPPTTRNIYLSTPNKLFECLAAGVPVVVSDFPAMRSIVLDDPLGPLGSACDPSDTADIVRALRLILDPDVSAREDLRRRCAAAAHERWNWESEASALLAAYEKALASRRSRRANRMVPEPTERS